LGNILSYFQAIIKEHPMRYDKYLLMLFLCICLTGCQEYVFVSLPKQNIEQPKSVDSRIAKNLLKLRPNEGLVYYNNEPFTGTGFEHYSNGHLASTTIYRNGKKHGVLRKWFENGKLSFESHYQKGRKDGKTLSWWSNGQLRSESTFNHGVANGIHYEWYKSGAKFKQLNLVNGKEEGLQKAWRENGKIYNNYEAKNGRIFGLKRANLCFELDDEKVQSGL